MGAGHIYSGDNHSHPRHDLSFIPHKPNRLIGRTSSVLLHSSRELLARLAARTSSFFS
ncbi:hypothetical protein LINGRAHAP2_LOCUS15182 [Linum grandiflorum]